MPSADAGMWTGSEDRDAGAGARRSPRMAAGRTPELPERPAVARHETARRDASVSAWLGFQREWSSSARMSTRSAEWVAQEETPRALREGDSPEPKISTPSAFKRGIHVEIDPTTGALTGLPDEWRDALAATAGPGGMTGRVRSGDVASSRVRTSLLPTNLALRQSLLHTKERLVEILRFAKRALRDRFTALYFQSKRPANTRRVLPVHPIPYTLRPTAKPPCYPSV
jgi:hypothetical protein